MRIIENIRATEQQPPISIYADEAHILLSERQVDVDNGNSTYSSQYEYDKVVVADANLYANVVEAATLFYKKEKKEKSLNSIVVTTSSGKQFYADPISRGDLSDAISIAQETGETSTIWKLKTGLDTVTLEEMQEARRLGLAEKGQIVGVKSIEEIQ